MKGSVIKGSTYESKQQYRVQTSQSQNHSDESDCSPPKTTCETSSPQIPQRYLVQKQIYCYESNRVFLITQKGSKQKLIAKSSPIYRLEKSKKFHQEQENKFIEVMKRTPHKHLIEVKQVIRTASEQICIMEYGCGGELTQHIITTPQLNTRQQMIQHISGIKFILWQVILALQAIHNLGYVYRDLKPSNILLTHTGIKLCDFGLVTEKGQIDYSLCGTPEYMPPERLSDKKRGLPLDSSIDMWSLGILAYQLLMGKTPFSYNGDLDDLKDQIYSGYIQFDQKFPTEIRHFIFNLLRPIPSKRLTIQKAKQHSIFKLGVQQTKMPCNCNL